MINKKLGYYTVFDKEFSSKIKALIYATNLYYKVSDSIIDPGSLVTWHFNDLEFDQYSWSQEPTTSLDHLYYKRARELREKYDYIIISYSGGADSHNIVRSFLDQKLKIDELVVVMLEKNIGEYTLVDPNITNAEYVHSAETNLQLKPRLREIISESPNTKITQIDSSDLIFKVFSNQKDGSWILNMREELNPTDVTRYNYSLSQEFRKQLDTGSTVGVVVGVDKPKIVIDSDTKDVHTRIVDRMANIVPIGEYIKEYSNTTIEYFYWHPNSLDIMCKQAHTIKNWLEKNISMQQYFYNRRPAFNHSNHIVRQLTDRLFRPILYSNWNPSWFQSDKPSNDWFSEEDNWFIKGAIGTKEHGIWLEGIKSVIKTTKPFIYMKKEKPHSFMSWYKDYYIGNLKRG